MTDRLLISELRRRLSLRSVTTEMGSCSSKAGSNKPIKSHVVPASNWDSTSYDTEEDKDMISLHGLFLSESTESVTKTGTTAGIPKRDVGEEETKQLEDTQTNTTNKTVRFVAEPPMEDVLTEIFSEESLLEKKRRSFNADLKIFSKHYT